MSPFSHGKNRWLSIAINVLLALSIVTAVSFITAEEEQSDIEKELWNSADNPPANSSGIVYFEDDGELETLFAESMLAVPILHSQDCAKGRATSEEQFAESLRNIRIFELLERTTNKETQMSHFFEEIGALSAVKHSKFTSVSAASQLSALSLQWWNPFFDRASREYEGVDRVFDRANSAVWVSDGQYFTFASDVPMRPSLFILELPSSHSNSTLNIYGISVFGAALASNRGFEVTLIKTVEVVSGVNRIRCDRP